MQNMFKTKHLTLNILNTRVDFKLKYVVIYHSYIVVEENKTSHVNDL